MAVPGLLACLALRYDASRATDMRTRAIAAADAITDALAALEVSAFAGTRGFEYRLRNHVSFCW